ncbi:unnamed protein product [Tilletia caries]|nr:unnamed protein product [Tilletia caries]
MAPNMSRSKRRTPSSLPYVLPSSTTRARASSSITRARASNNCPLLPRRVHGRDIGTAQKVVPCKCSTAQSRLLIVAMRLFSVRLILLFPSSEPALSSANLLEGRTLISSPTSTGDLSSGHPLDPQASSAIHVAPPSDDISFSNGSSRLAQLSLSPFRPSEASSPSAPPPSPTRPDAVKTEPEPTSDSAWIAPATWRPPGRYVRVRHAPLISRGGSVELARVVDVLLGRTVCARKRIRFLNEPPRFLLFEVEALTPLQGHKGITQLLDVCYTTHKVDIIMPLYWGTLQDLFDQANGRELETSLAKNLTLQLLVAVSFIHRKEVIHLDIKPANLMLTRDFTIK